MYNFSEFDKLFSSMKSGVKASDLTRLKSLLNGFFKDSTCLEVIYTNNTDKMFFGMCVLPVLPTGYLLDSINGKAPRFEKYYLELDSKLFNPLLGLSNGEYTAITLHEVGHIVNNAAVARGLSDGINYTIANDGAKLDYDKIMQNEQFLNIAVLKSIHTLTSIFEKNDKEFIADEFVVNCGYGSQLESAYDKIIKNRDSINSTDKNLKLSTLIWSLRVYKDMTARRKAILDLLDRSYDTEGSSLFKKAYKKAYEAIKGLKPVHESMMAEDFAKRYITESDFFKKIKYAGINNVEADLYEYNIRAKNIEDETDAMDVLRSINIRVALIEEYLASENVEKSKADRLNGILDKFKNLRDIVVRDAATHKKYWGLFVEYPDINKNSRL